MEAPLKPNLSTVSESGMSLFGQHHLGSNGPAATTVFPKAPLNGTKTSAPPVVNVDNMPTTFSDSSVKSHPDRSNISIPLNNQPSFKPRKLRAIIIGAGYSGLTLAHKLRYQHPEMEDIVDYKIFEARSEIGGTWLVNTYPGVQCDVPAHIYVRTQELEHTLITPILPVH